MPPGSAGKRDTAGDLPDPLRPGRAVRQFGGEMPEKPDVVGKDSGAVFGRPVPSG